MSAPMKWILRGVLLVSTSLLLYQFDVGWFGFLVNWFLLILVILSSYVLGYWGME